MFIAEMFSTSLPPSYNSNLCCNPPKLQRNPQHAPILLWHFFKMLIKNCTTRLSETFQRRGLELPIVSIWRIRCSRGAIFHCPPGITTCSPIFQLPVLSFSTLPEPRNDHTFQPRLMSQTLKNALSGSHFYYLQPSSVVTCISSIVTLPSCPSVWAFHVHIKSLEWQLMQGFWFPDLSMPFLR